MLGKARRYRGSCGAVPRVGVSFISLMQDIWTTLQVWFLVIEGPLLGFFFFF